MAEIHNNCSKTLFDVENLLAPGSYNNQLFMWQRTSLTVVFCILVGISLVANLYSLAILHNRTYHTLYKFCLYSQSISDLLIAVTVGCDQIIRLSRDTIEWKLGSIGCVLVPLLSTIGILASSFTLTCIALDRVLSIIRAQHHYHPNIMISLAIILTIWILAGGASVPMGLYYDFKTYCEIKLSSYTILTCSQCVDLCQISTIVDRTTIYNYFIILFSIIFLPVFIAFVASYVALANYVRNRRKRLNNRETSSTSVTNIEGTEIMSQAPPKSLKTVSKRKDVHIQVLIFIILVTFIVCRLPLWVLNLISFRPHVNLSYNSSYYIKAIFSALNVLNTALNPFIYSLMNNAFKIKKCFC